MERILSIVSCNYMRIFTAIFHKADYIFFLFTQLVTKVVHCTLHGVYGMKTFMAHIQMFLIMWCLDEEQQATSNPQHQSPKAFLLFCKSQPLLPVGQGQNIQCLPFPQKELSSVIEISESNLCCDCFCFWIYPLNS